MELQERSHLYPSLPSPQINLVMGSDGRLQYAPLPQAPPQYSMVPSAQSFPVVSAPVLNSDVIDAQRSLNCWGKSVRVASGILLFATLVSIIMCAIHCFSSGNGKGGNKPCVGMIIGHVLLLITAKLGLKAGKFKNSDAAKRFLCMLILIGLVAAVLVGLAVNKSMYEARENQRHHHDRDDGKARPHHEDKNEPHHDQSEKDRNNNLPQDNTIPPPANGGHRLLEDSALGNSKTKNRFLDESALGNSKTKNRFLDESALGNSKTKNRFLDESALGNSKTKNRLLEGEAENQADPLEGKKDHKNEDNKHHKDDENDGDDEDDSDDSDDNDDSDDDDENNKEDDGQGGNVPEDHEHGKGKDSKENHHKKDGKENGDRKGKHHKGGRKHGARRAIIAGGVVGLVAYCSLVVIAYGLLKAARRYESLEQRGNVPMVPVLANQPVQAYAPGIYPDRIPMGAPIQH